METLNWKKSTHKQIQYIKLDEAATCSVKNRETYINVEHILMNGKAATCSVKNRET